MSGTDLAHDDDDSIFFIKNEPMVGYDPVVYFVFTNSL